MIVLKISKNHIIRTMNGLRKIVSLIKRLTNDHLRIIHWPLKQILLFLLSKGLVLIFKLFYLHLSHFCSTFDIRRVINGVHLILQILIIIFVNFDIGQLIACSKNINTLSIGILLILLNNFSILINGESVKKTLLSLFLVAFFTTSKLKTFSLLIDFIKNRMIPWFFDLLIKTFESFNGSFSSFFLTFKETFRFFRIILFIDFY